MEEMHRMHKEPVWGWVAVVAGMMAKYLNAKASAPARPASAPRRAAPSVVTPWSPRSPAGWSA